MKKHMGILLVLVLALSLAACSPKNPEGPPPTDVEEPGNGSEDPVPSENSKEVNLYFGNLKYVETGDESHEKLLVEKRLINYENSSLEEEIVRELMKGPEDTSNKSTSIPDTAQLLGVELVDGTAYVDFAQEGMNGGSLQESFTINQIVSSLLELDSVERVQFLIDGNVGESLMGHYTIDQPFDGAIE